MHRRKELRILFITMLDLGKPDGAIVQVIDIEKSLNGRGHETLFLCPFPRGIKLLPAGRHLFIPCIRVSRLRYISYNLFFPFYLLYTLLSFRPNIVFVRGTPNHILKIIYILASHIPVVNLLNDIPPIGHSLVLLNKKFNNNTICFPFEGPALDPSVFYPQDVSIVRKKLGFSESKFIIGFTASPGAKENYDYNLLVEGFAKFCGKHPDSLLLIMGDIHPRFKSDFLTLASKRGIVDKIIITGFISHQQLNLYLNACDVCVAPLSKERLLENPFYSGAVKVWEYFGCAKPVIKSDIPNSRTFHWFKDKCIIVPPDDVEAFVRTLFHLYENPTLRKELGEKAYKWVLENHTWDKRAEKIEDFFWKIVKEV